MLSLEIGVVEQSWPHTVDARVWVEKWMEHLKKDPSIATDEGTMLGWFANAIMAGYDTATLRCVRSNPVATPPSV
jgi:hypothetical protein